MILVIDASAAIEIALGKQSSSKFKEVLAEADLVLAPDTYVSEITNVFWKYASAKEIEITKCEKGIDYCIDIVDDFVNTRELYREVFGESLRKKHSVYDIFYLVLARRRNAGILSMDKKLNKIAEEMEITVLGK